MHARGHGLLHLGVTVLAGCPPLDVAHAAGSGLVAIDARHLLFHMDVLRKTSRFGEFLSQVAVAAPPFHRSGVADEGAPAGTGTVHRRRDTAEGVRAPLAGRRIVAVKTPRVTEVACLLLGDRLIRGKRLVELLGDL